MTARTQRDIELLSLDKRLQELSPHEAWRKNLAWASAIIRIVVAKSRTRRPTVGLSEDGELDCAWTIRKTVLVVTFDLPARTVRVSLGPLYDVNVSLRGRREKIAGLILAWLGVVRWMRL